MTGHDYGPHDRDAAPETVTRAEGGMSRRFGGTRVRWLEVPVHPAIRKQRERMNTIAHEQAQERRRAAEADQ